ncbi:hypothetical protein IW262DRAFT_1348864 [Armillaria fumosa]|nr:hypothetical protein IW262DRAFT_1348864 [Armillaria fumosa]
MSSIALPSRGRCVQFTDSQPCQCQWFFPPESPLLDRVGSRSPLSIFLCSVSQLVCSLCGHGVHAHADYVSDIVNHYPANQCAAYAQTTHLTQRCTCEAQFYEHVATDNWYRLPELWTALDYFNPDTSGPSRSATTSNDPNGPFFPNTMASPNFKTSMFYGNATSVLFTPTYMPYIPRTSNRSHSSGDAAIFTPIQQPVAQMAITQIEAHSHSEMENSYSVQYKDDNFSVNVQDSRARFHQDYPYRAAHGTEAWAGQPD